MKTHLPLTQKCIYKTLSFMSIMMLTLLTSNSIYGQTRTVNTTEVATNERTIKGVVTDGKASLKDVNVILKGTKNGTTTNEKGEFTFPTKLKTGDILIFSYLGYEKQEIKIKDNISFIKLVLTEDLIEMVGALDTAKPYKSKRKNK